MTLERTWIAVLMLCTGMPAQVAIVRGRVEVAGSPKAGHTPFPNTVVWLAPATGTPVDPAGAAVDPPAPVRLTQKNKSFEPHVLVVPAGSAVEFPNRDPFFHNVFSLFEGKRFDLGLYEAGTTRIVHFDRVGVSYIFCNIHPEMNAIVLALKTPYYGISNAAGQISIPNVPEGRYTMQVFAEKSGLENLKKLTKTVTLSAQDQSLGVIHVVQDGPPGLHKNKYGRDYDAPGSDYPANNLK